MQHRGLRLSWVIVIRPRTFALRVAVARRRGTRGPELHRWFNERYGGYFDATYNDIRHEPNSWSYTMGLRARF